MQFAFSIPHSLRLKALTHAWEAAITGPDQQRLIKRAEALGYDMISVPEHFLVPTDHLDLSGPHYFHAAAAQGFIAGASERIRVNSCLTILPLHNPIILAKALSTIDWMSGGRITVTVGVGWDKGEFDLLGVPFHERGKMSDEYLAAMIALWTEEKPSFEGKYVSFRDAAFEPKPARKPHLPIWMGGDADGPLKRAARFASGWMPFLTKEKDIPDRLDFIKSQPEYDGRPFEVSYSLATASVGEGHVVLDNPDLKQGRNVQFYVDRIGELADKGVTITGIPSVGVKSAEEYMDHAQWVIEEIKPKVA